MSATAKPPPDDAMLKTLFIGMLGAAAFYGLGLVAQFLVGGPVGVWVGFGFIASSIVFVLVWWYAPMRRGFRVGKGPNKREIRAKEKQRAEKEKLRALRMRR